MSDTLPDGRVSACSGLLVKLVNLSQLLNRHLPGLN